MDKDIKMIKLAKSLAEKERIKMETDILMINKIKKYEEELARLKEDVNRVVEENSNWETINKSHKTLNGELRKELSEVKEDNRKLAKQISNMEQNYIRIDGKG